MIRRIALLIAGLSGMAAAAPAPEDAVLLPIRQLLDGFNQGDLAFANAAYATGLLTIIDEVPPFRWSGPRAAQRWMAAYRRHAAALGITGGVVAYDAPTRIEIDGANAYVVLPTLSRYRRKDAPIIEEAQMTYVLRKQAAGWKISSWTWTGVVPHRAE